MVYNGCSVTGVPNRTPGHAWCLGGHPAHLGFACAERAVRSQETTAQETNSGRIQYIWRTCRKGRDTGELFQGCFVTCTLRFRNYRIQRCSLFLRPFYCSGMIWNQVDPPYSYNGHVIRTVHGMNSAVSPESLADLVSTHKMTTIHQQGQGNGKVQRDKRIWRILPHIL